MVSKENYLFLLVALALCSCSSLTKREQQKLKESYTKKEYTKSLKLVGKSKLYNDKNNQLLRLIELAKLHYNNSSYYLSSQLYQEVLGLISKSYTKSITKEVLVSISNDKNATYIPDLYEQSFIYLYQAMNFLMISQNRSYSYLNDKSEKIIVELSKQEEKKYHEMARAMMLAWDSFNRDSKRTLKLTKPLLSEIVMNRFAAKVHLSFNTKSESLIALNLLKNTYQKISKAKKEKLLLDYPYEKSLKELSEIIGRLTKKYRSWDFKKSSKKFSFNTNQTSAYKQSNSLFIELKSKGSLVSTPFSYTLNSAIKSMKDGPTKDALNTIGIPLLTSFATGTLGLGYIHSEGNNYIRVANSPLDKLAGEVGIEFYLPTYEYKEKSTEFKLVLKGKNQIVFEKQIISFSPIDQISAQMNKFRLERSYNKLGVRIGIKYVAALITAYGTYQTLNAQESSFASTLALGQYVLSSKAIMESEQADVRYWVTLPSQIYDISVEQPAGEYTLELYSINNGKWDLLEGSAPVSIPQGHGNIIPVHI